MATLDQIVKEIEVKASQALVAGEKAEEVASAVFEELFNWFGREGDLRDWAVTHANNIMTRVSSKATSPQPEKIKTILSELVELLTSIRESDPSRFPRPVLVKMKDAVSILNGGDANADESGRTEGRSDSTVSD